jgi:hypothetical protein
MEIILEYKNNTFAVKQYEDKHLMFAGVRKDKRQAVKLFNQLVKELNELRELNDFKADYSNIII